jgi:hypothetical protein
MHRSVTCALQGPPMVGHPLIGVCTTEHAAAVEWQWIRSTAAPTASNGSGGKSPKRSGKGKSGSDSSSKQQKAAGFTIELPTSSSRCVVLEQSCLQCSTRYSVVADNDPSYDCWLHRLINIMIVAMPSHPLQSSIRCVGSSHVVCCVLTPPACGCTDTTLASMTVRTLLLLYCVFAAAHNQQMVASQLQQLVTRQ